MFQLGRTIKFEVKGTYEDEYMELNDTAITLAVGAKYYLNAIAYPTYAQSITYESSNTSVATVDEYGLITAVSAGTIDITVTATGGLTATCTVTVEESEG